MRTIIVGAFAVAISSFAAAQSLDDLKDKWHQCIARKADALDDGLSPASDIAEAVSGECGDEHQAMIDRLSFSPEAKYRVSTERRSRTKEVATTIVLMLRAERRNRR